MRKSARYSGVGRPKGAVSGLVGRQFVPNAGLKQYTGAYQATKRRHQFLDAVPTVEPATSTALNNIGPNEYWIQRCFRMRRTFDATNPDVEPTPTASNNFNSSSVMNGSTIDDFDMLMRFKNTSATVSPTIDVFKICLSFYDAYIWNGLAPSNCPLTFTTSTGPPDNTGMVTEKTPTSSIISQTVIDNFKFHQHYLQKVAEITIGNTDTDNVSEFRVRGVPAKVKRMQTGAYYAYLFYNSSNKNAGSTFNLEYSCQYNFTETPSGIRPPYVL